LINYNKKITLQNTKSFKSLIFDILAICNNLKTINMKKTHLILISFIIACMNIKGQPANTFTDTRDGQTYRIVKIGNQFWFAENLSYSAPAGSWCYDNKEQNCKEYGRLYDWLAARTACPYGWYLPEPKDFENLINTLKANNIPTYAAVTTEGAHGFNALRGGWREYAGRFNDININGYFWSSQSIVSNTDKAWALTVLGNRKEVDLYDNSKEIGFSVRCMRYK